MGGHGLMAGDCHGGGEDSCVKGGGISLSSHLSAQTTGDRGCVLDLVLSCVNRRLREMRFYFC